jgi:hypothetical protein
MNLQICEIVSALSAPGEPVIASRAEQVTSVAQPIQLCDELEEMDLSEGAVFVWTDVAPSYGGR